MIKPLAREDKRPARASRAFVLSCVRAVVLSERALRAFVRSCLRAFVLSERALRAFQVPGQVWNLEFGICLGFGIWNLEFPLTGVSGLLSVVRANILDAGTEGNIMAESHTGRSRKARNALLFPPNPDDWFECPG